MSPKIINSSLKATKTEIKKSGIFNQSLDTKNIPIENVPFLENIKNPLWLSISEAAKLGGMSDKTVRRGIQFLNLKYKIVNDRYLVEFNSLLSYIYSKTKLRNKFEESGLGQYVKEWME